MSEKNHMGGCSCGRVRYRMTDDPLIVHACHCRMCQRLTGSTNAVNALIEVDKVILMSGETTDHLALTPSGDGQNITRCSHCQVAVWSEYLAFTKRCGASMLFVRAGTLDFPEKFPPDVHIFTDSRQRHVAVDDGLPGFAAFYDLKQVWSEDSIRRLNRFRDDLAIGCESPTVPRARQATTEG